MRRLAVLVTLAGVSLATACTPPPPPGSQRYLDEVFANVTVQRDLQYGEATDEHGQPEVLRLDLYQPAGDTATNRPVIVWVHGGGFTRGDKGDSLPVQYATRWAKRGYVSASINYRLREDGSGGGALDAQHDAQAAVRWFRANAATLGIDPDRLGIGGTSAGAITSLLVNYHSDDPGSSGNPGFSSEVAAASSIAGCLYGGTVFVDPGELPVLLIHGVDDQRVPYECAVATRDAAVAAGNVAELVSRQGGHDVTAWVNPNLATMTPFFFENVVSS
jgi:acetyl esterase/lipase